MDLKEIKFFIGPMSKNIVDTIVNFSIKENYKIGICASRRQIDWDGGYVNNWTTDELIDYIPNKENLILERDHGGIGQGLGFDNGAISYMVDANNFDIIHIDPFYHFKNDFQRALNETIDNIQFINKINPDCLFEIGTEESIYYFDEPMLYNMLWYFKSNLSDDLFSKIVYCVIQSGTGLKGTNNIGLFDAKRLEKMIEICNKFGILSKEHNGDYLSLKALKYRFSKGLSAINIAPEFGVFETDILLEFMTDEQKENFFDICYKSDKWHKWVNVDFNPFENKIELIRICGHYQFSKKEFLDMNLNLDEVIKMRLYNKLKKLSEI